jgi:hypothetical protein
MTTQDPMAGEQRWEVRNTNPDLHRVPEPPGPDYDTRDQDGYDEPEGDRSPAGWARIIARSGGQEPRDPPHREVLRDLDQSDVEADAARMREDYESRQRRDRLAGAVMLMHDVPGLPCTFGACNAFYYADLHDEPDEDIPQPPGGYGNGWLFIPITPEAEEIIDVHDHRTMFDQGHYLPGFDGKPAPDDKLLA